MVEGRVGENCGGELWKRRAVRGSVGGGGWGRAAVSRLLWAPAIAPGWDAEPEAVVHLTHSALSCRSPTQT